MKPTDYSTLFIFADQAAFDNRADEHKDINGISQELYDALLAKYTDEWGLGRSLRNYDGEADGNKGCWNCIQCAKCVDCYYCIDCDYCTDVVGAYSKMHQSNELYDQFHSRFDLPTGFSPASACQVFVPDVFAKIWKGVNQNGLDMSAWHGVFKDVRDKEKWECDTVHCWAGWAIHVGGKEAYACEQHFDTAAVAMNIFRRATPGIPVYHGDFYMPDDYAKWRIEECAKMEKELNSADPDSVSLYQRVLNFLRSLYHN